MEREREREREEKVCKDDQSWDWDTPPRGMRGIEAAKHLVEFRANLNLPGLHDITPVP